MIKFDENKLKQLEELGELQFSYSECAIILGVNIEEFKEAIVNNAKIKNTYEKGRLSASAAVRKSILQQAKQGSTPAQKQMLTLIENASKKEDQKKSKAKPKTYINDLKLNLSGL